VTGLRCFTDIKHLRILFFQGFFEEILVEEAENRARQIAEADQPGQVETN